MKKNDGNANNNATTTDRDCRNVQGRGEGEPHLREICCYGGGIIHQIAIVLLKAERAARGEKEGSVRPSVGR